MREGLRVHDIRKRAFFTLIKHDCGLVFWCYSAAWGGSSSVALIVLYSPVVASSLYKQTIFASGERVCMYNPPDYRYHNRTVIDSIYIGLTLDGLFVWTWCQHVWSAFGSSNSNFEHRGRRAIWGKDSRPASECRSLALKNCRRIVTRLKHAICGDSTSSTPALMYLAAWPMTWGFAALHSS